MYLARRGHSGPDGIEPRIVVTDDPGKGWVDVRRWQALSLERRGATPSGARRLAAAFVPGSMSAALAEGEAFLDVARAAIAGERESIDDAQFLAALDPSGYRDHMTFEGHFSYGYEWQGLTVPQVMYEMPISYFGNPLAFYGPNDEIPWPHYSKRLDYELELGIVIGRPGRDLTPETALDHVVGYTILNDCSARDIQQREMKGGLGPSKGKHFACVAGPYLTTPDSLSKSGLKMQAWVNGERTCEATSAEMMWSVAEVVAWASQSEWLEPGMLLGSGTCNGGCALEIQRDLAPGDLIELEIEGLGRTRNRYGVPPTSGWWPDAKRSRR
ncbi:MAG TPA: fumarylacetoacetate hydrolase family protein [Steroidobacteraceae bacterium]|nr:fumarylacetoacetate hydrolase family protein [Steroidobacteraceae bacterium]